MTVKHFLINILPNRVFPRKKENEKKILKNGGTAVQTVQPLSSKGCSCTTSVPLSNFQGLRGRSRGHFGKTETEKRWENTYGKGRQALW